MKALRQIVDVKNHSLNILLPESFASTKVEIIVLPIEDQILQRNSIAKLRGKLKLTSKQHDDFQQNVIDSRHEWNRSI